MVDFTSEQLQEIRNSDEFKEFVEKWEKEGIDRDATLNDYLGNALNRSKWEEKFSDSKDIPLQDEQQSTQEELAKTEHKLETHLHTVYADGILQAGQDLPEKFWETDDYKRWTDNYNDKETQELKDRIQQLQANTTDNKKDFSQKVADEKSSKLDNGEVLSWVEEEKSDKHYQYEIRESTKNANGYLRTNHSFVDRDGQSDHFIINETSRFDKDNKHTQTLKSKNVNARLDGAEFEGIILYGNERNRQEIQAKVVEQENMVILTIDGKYHSFDKDVFTNEEKSKQIETWLQNTQGLSVNEAKSVAAGIISTNKDVKDISQILQTHNRAIKGIANPPKVTDIERKKDTIIQDVVYETTKERERSPLSDENEFMIDKIKLKALLDMEIISQDVYDQAIKNPAYAIEQINQKIPLKEEQQIEFENRVSDYMLENEETFKLLPPMLLAKQYKKALEEKEKEQKQDENVKSDGKVDAKISKLESRMDELSSNLYHKQDLFFADITNISDTYDGYMQMFEAREQTLGQEGEDKVKRDIISVNRDSLDKLINDYDNRWNLQDVQSADADKLNERFDKLNKELEKLDVNDETLELVSNFQFINENNEPEPQFIDKDGNKSLKYSEGCQVIQDSKLANIIRVAKQNVLMETLGTKDDIDIEKLQSSLNEKVPEVLYAAHVANQVEQGIKENPDQFTDKKYLNQFVADLGNTEKPMSVSPTAYEATIDGCVNAVGGFAHRLGSKIGKDKAVVTKLFTPLKDLDKRADDRTTKKVDKQAYRMEMLKRTAKGGISAFLVSGAITVFGTAAAADASLTAATGGLNKFTGMAIGSALAIGMTAYQIHNWNKDRKARGGKTGPKAFFKDMIKDRRLAMTIGTTALGAAALGFAATGNPGVAQALGIGALALGTSNMAINTVQDAKEQGISTLEGIGWAALQSVVNVGAAYGGRIAANAGIDAYNNSHEDNKIFQHRGKIGTVPETHTTTEIEIGYRDGVVENAQKILDYWYNDNPELLQQRIEAIEAYNAEHGTNINPQRYLLAAHDAGALSADNNLLHNQGAADTYTNAQHKVFGQSWSNTTGVSQDVVDTLASSVNGGEVNITTESLEAFAQLDKFISSTNQVGYAEAAPYQNDGVLGYNAEAEASGRMVASENGDRWTTYADGERAFEQKIVERTVTEEVDKYGMVRNETDLGLGMFGVLGRRLKNLQLKERMGSLLDRITGKKTTSKSNVDIIPTPPLNDQNGIKDKEQDQNPPKDIGDNKKAPIVPVIPGDEKKKEETKDVSIAPTPVENKQEIIRRLSQGENNNDALVNELIEKEYRITRGHLTGEVDKNQVAEYKKLVEAEYQAESSIIRGGNMEVYLKRRMNTFEKVCANRKNEYSETNIAIIANKARQDMWKRNIAVDGEIIDASQTTLLHLTEVANMSSQGNMGSARKAALSPEKGPLPEYKQDRPHGYAVEINPGQTMREKFDRAINQHNAQQIAKIKQSQSK